MKQLSITISLLIIGGWCLSPVSAEILDGKSGRFSLLSPSLWSTGGLFASERIRTSNIAIFSFSSANTPWARKGGVGAYLNTMDYTLSQPLSLKVHLGYKYSVLESLDEDGRVKNRLPLYGLTLLYSPTRSLHMGFEYGTTERGLYSFPYQSQFGEPMLFWLHKSFFDSTINFHLQIRSIRYPDQTSP